MSRIFGDLISMYLKPALQIKFINPIYSTFMYGGKKYAKSQEVSSKCLHVPPLPPLMTNIAATPYLNTYPSRSINMLPFSSLITDTSPVAILHRKLPYTLVSVDLAVV